MSWKNKLGIEKNNYIFSYDIDNYFLDLGFYYDEMKPRFMNGSYYEQISLEERVLRFDGDYERDREGTQRVFMNKKEIYIERQTNYRSFDGSNYKDLSTLDEPLSIKLLEEFLDELVE